MRAEPAFDFRVSGERLELTAVGSWTTSHSDTLEKLAAAAALQIPAAPNVVINMSGVRELDTLGAWVIERFVRRCSAGGKEPQLVGLPEKFRGLLDTIRRVNRRTAPEPDRPGRLVSALDAVGRTAADLKVDILVFLEMLAALTAAILRMLLHPTRFRLTSAVHFLYRVCWQAIPIVALITFLIGCIIAQQGIFHFRKFGAESYVVDMVGILVLREIGVLIVSVMIAGRSGSAFTAELGSMKMREEIDALRTMGFDPVEVLILPRIAALVCALPILAFVGAMSALYGGGLVAWLYGDMSPPIYIARLREAISVTHFEVGMIKAPFMALVIGIVACAEGLRVQGSAESLGLHTTDSVVKSIFLVIVLDGVFAMFFASIGM